MAGSSRFKPYLSPDVGRKAMGYGDIIWAMIDGALMLTGRKPDEKKIKREAEIAYYETDEGRKIRSLKENLHELKSDEAKRQGDTEADR